MAKSRAGVLTELQAEDDQYDWSNGWPFDWGESDSLEDAQRCAQWFWNNDYEYIEKFADACSQARTNKGVYEGLWAWALEQDNLPDDRKIALYDALVRKKPRAGKAETVNRDNMIRSLAGVLVKWYPLPPSPDRRHPAAAIIAKVKGCNISEGRISNILRTKTSP